MATALLLLLLGAGGGQAQTQLESVVIGYGGGHASSAAGKATVTLQTVAGATAATGGGARLGFWEVYGSLAMTDVLDPPELLNQLFQNAPNPFNPRTTIRFSLATEARTRIEVFDLQGRRVDRLLDEIVPAGEHALVYQPERLASGVYLLKLQAGSFNATSRLVLLK